MFGQHEWSILGNTVLALLEYPGSTLLSINQMLSVKEFRKKVVDNITDPVVKAFWTQEFAKYTERFAAEATPAIQNKVGQLTSNPLIRNIAGQKKSSFDLRQVMDEKKILIINLAKGRVGEDTARLLGAMMVTKLYLAAMSRVDIAEESNREDFFLYVDEFQNFATESFADILSEARKYKLSLTLAHQFMAQLAEEVRDAVIGNVGTMLTFRVGAEDAEFLEKEFSPEFMATDIVNLGFAQIYLKLMIDGVAQRPFSASTLPPIEKTHGSFREAIVAASRGTYARPKEEIDNQILEWSENIASDAEVGGASSSKDKRGKSEGGEDKFASSTDKPRPDMHEAICFVCGKKTDVPFVPDPSRPVFCKEHIGLAGKVTELVQLQKGAGRSPSGSGRESRPQQSETRPRVEEKRKEAKPHEYNKEASPKVEQSSSVPTVSPKPSLHSSPPIQTEPPQIRTQRGEFAPRANQEPRDEGNFVSLKKMAKENRLEPQKSDKQEHLSALREALKKTLENKNSKESNGAKPQQNVNTESTQKTVSPQHPPEPPQRITPPPIRQAKPREETTNGTSLEL
jgi:CxxC-x17-CxxC domain-containing protein